MKLISHIICKIFILITMLLLLSPNVALADNMQNDLFQVGVSEYRSGNYKKTVDLMKQLLNQDCSNNYARYYLAISLVKLNNTSEAISEYEKILITEQDANLLGYARKGLDLIKPKEKVEVAKTNVNMLEVKENKPDKIVNNNTTAQQAYSSSQDDDFENDYNSYNTQTTDSETIAKVAAENNLDPKELNNLINLLAKNPGALQTLNKLAASPNSTLPQQQLQQKKPDYKAIAQLMKTMMLNSALNSMSSSGDNDNKSNNGMNSGFDSSMMMMMSTMAGGEGGMMPNMGMNPMAGMMGGFQMPAQNGQIDPKSIDLMMRQNMFSDMGGF